MNVYLLYQDTASAGYMLVGLAVSIVTLRSFLFSSSQVNEAYCDNMVKNAQYHSCRCFLAGNACPAQPGHGLCPKVGSERTCVQNSAERDLAGHDANSSA